MTDAERGSLLLRYEALITKVELTSTTAFQDDLIKAIERTVGKFVTTEDESDLRRRREVTRVIVDQLDPAFKDLGMNLLDDMSKVAGNFNKFAAGLYKEDPIDKVYKFTNKTLINNYELGDLLHSNHTDAVKRFKMVVAQGISEGKSSKQVARDLKNSGEKIYDWVSDIVVQGAIKTANVEAMNDTFAQLEKDGLVEEYEWVATLELNTCQQCAALDGTTWKTYTKAPPLPAHFRCRCTIVPITEWGRSDTRAGMQYDKDGNEIVASGKQFENISYDEWLKLQPKEVQTAINSKKQISYKEFKKLMAKEPIKANSTMSKQQKAGTKPKT